MAEEGLQKLTHKEKKNEKKKEGKTRLQKLTPKAPDPAFLILPSAITLWHR